MAEGAVLPRCSSPPIGGPSDVSPVVFLLDNDPSVVLPLACLLQTEGFSIRRWTSATEFLEAHNPRIPGCLVTDLCMSERGGFEVQRALLTRGIDRPFIFIAAEGDIRTTVQGMKAGAVSVLGKPVQPAELVTAVREAIAKDAAMRARRRAQADIRARLARLTPRERQVLYLITTGMRNKEIAAELGAVEQTIKVHRGRVLKKMQVPTSTALAGLLHRVQLLPILHSSALSAYAPRAPLVTNAGLSGGLRDSPLGKPCSIPCRRLANPLKPTGSAHGVVEAQPAA